ncbi:MAG: efflux RND transporter periplasmic adaptor subunit [Kiritimatiellaceae bacterium]|nr:efflux RND transporter periplasmic adaptor subunit [Kiritimatiellaceae bacterium]
MKKRLVILSGLLITLHAYAQTNKTAEAGCDCPACLAKAAGETLPYTLPALQELNTPQAEASAPEQETKTEKYDHAAGAGSHAGHDHDTEEAGHDEHEGADQAPDAGLHDGHEHATDIEEEDPHAGCDHAPEVAEADPHAGHDHATDTGCDGGAVEGVEISTEMAEKIGLQVHEAGGGMIARAAVFPAEIKLNRDSMAAVSPRYASIVRQVFAEIGDTVKKGDILASLENRETMAVYTVTAPLDGIIISKDLAVGETAVDDKVLFEVADLSSVWADISIFPRYQHLLRKGMSVKFIAHDGHTARGKVKYLSPIVSHETRTFTAHCVLEGVGEDFTPGAFVRAKINVETAKVPVRVERDAVQNLAGESVVFAPGDHGFLPVVVELGLADEHAVEIKTGLKPGDPYVAVGAFALKAQMVTSGMDPHAGHGH